MSHAIEIRGLQKRYGDHHVLDGVDLSVPYGAVHGLLGANGAGKTTLVRILATLLPYEAGAVTVAGHDVVGAARAVRSTIGLTGQYASVDELLTGRENLRLLGRLLHLRSSEVRPRADELLERFALTDAADRRVVTYSGGMRRRLDIAASLLAKPRIVFLDEPTTGLDPRSRRAMWDVVNEMTTDGVTVLLTTQYLEEADELADRISVLDRGDIVLEGTPRELKRHIGNERLTLTFVNTDTRDQAAHALARTDTQANLNAAALTAPIGGPDDLRGVLETLSGYDLGAYDIEVAAPTLDDVFFATTGQPHLKHPADAPDATMEVLQ